MMSNYSERVANPAEHSMKIVLERLMNDEPLDLRYVHLKKEISKDRRLVSAADHVFNQIILGHVRVLQRLRCCWENADAGLAAFDKLLNHCAKKWGINSKKKKKKAYDQALASMNALKTACEPFAIQMEALHHDELKRLCEDMMARGRGRSSESKWRRRANNAFVKLASAIVLLGTVALATIVAPAIAALGATSVLAGLKDLETWIDSRWERKEKKRGQKEAALRAILDVGLSVVQELEGVGRSVRELWTCMESIDRELLACSRYRSKGEESAASAEGVRRMMVGARAQVMLLKEKADTFNAARKKAAKDLLLVILDK